MKKVSSWKDLTLREKIGQTVVCLCETEKHIEMCGSIAKFAKKYPIGGIFNNGGLVKGLLVDENPDFKKIVDEYNKHLRVPLFATADFANYAKKFGLKLPSQMALGATDNEELAYKAGEFIANDCIKSGLNWILWPVCDLSVSEKLPTTVRAISDKWALNAKLVAEEIKATRDKKIISTLKHFPGCTEIDLDVHLAPTDNKTPLDLWWNTYGKMYKEIIKENPPSLMTGHDNFVEYQTEMIDGEYPPATLSYELTTKLLRDELGFKGVVVTDALCMGGFTGKNAVDNCVKSFLAGNDVLLWPVYEYIDEMERRILSGEIDEAVLDKSVERIWKLKEEYGILDNIELTSDADEEYFKEIAEKISEKSLTLIQNYNNMLPLKKEECKNVLVVAVTPSDEQFNALSKLKDEFEKYGCKADVVRNIWTDELEKKTKEYDKIVFALCRTFHQPIGPMDFWGEEATSIWASNTSDKTKTIILNFGTPYIYKYYKKSGYTYVNTYAFDRNTVESTVKALFGDIKFEGKSSVTL